MDAVELYIKKVKQAMKQDIKLIAADIFLIGTVIIHMEDGKEKEKERIKCANLEKNKELQRKEYDRQIAKEASLRVEETSLRAKEEALQSEEASLRAKEERLDARPDNILGVGVNEKHTSAVCFFRDRDGEPIGTGFAVSPTSVYSVP